MGTSFGGLGNHILENHTILFPDPFQESYTDLSFMIFINRQIWEFVKKDVTL